MTKTKISSSRPYTSIADRDSVYLPIPFGCWDLVLLPEDLLSQAETHL